MFILRLALRYIFLFQSVTDTRRARLGGGKRPLQALQEQKLQSKKTRRSKTQSKSDPKNMPITKLKKELDEVSQEQLEWSQSAWEKLSSANENLIRENVLIQTENKKLQEDILKRDATLFKYKQTLALKETQIELLEEQFSNERRTLTDTISVLRDENKNLADEVALQRESLAEHKHAQTITESEIKHLQEKFTNGQHDIQTLQAQLKISKNNNMEITYQVHHWLVVAAYLNTRLNAVYASNSWKVTWPLRQTSTLLRKLILLPQKFLTFLVKAMIQFVLDRPLLRQKGLEFFANKPTLKAKLKQIAINNGLLAPSTSSTELVSDSVISEEEKTKQGLAELSPKTNKIYHELQATLEKYCEK